MGKLTLHQTSPTDTSVSKLTPTFGYAEHLKMAVEKASTIAVSLVRQIPDVHDLRERKRRLLTSVIHSKLPIGSMSPVEQVDKKSTPNIESS